MQQKYTLNHTLLFMIFFGLSLFYLLFGYATLGTNDDWALRSLLAAKGVYGTLVMSYPLSYAVSKLYDYLPYMQWYSLLLSTIVLLNFYLIAIFISKQQGYAQKIILSVLALLYLSYIWFNISITIVTIVTIVSAIGLFRSHLGYSFLLLALASLLRSDMVLIFSPFMLLSYFLLRDQFGLTKKEFLMLALPLLLLASNIYLQKQDKPYTQWLLFNQARSTVFDFGILDTKKILTEDQKSFLAGGWVQDEELLPTAKVIEAMPAMRELIQMRLTSFDLKWFANHHFHHWLYLLALFTLLALLFNLKNKKAPLLLIFVIGALALTIIRDVDRVTIPLFILWVFFLLQMLKNQIAKNLFLLIFTSIFAYYFYPQLGYHFYKENTLLLKEARNLIKESSIICEPSMQFPTNLSQEEINIFQSLYLFHENDWLKINTKEILPAGWLSRHPYSYEAHNLSDSTHTRKYPNYHAFLIDDTTGFIGGKQLTASDTTKRLLETYDKLYLKETPHCRHITAIAARSEHFAISQIRIECK